LIADRKNQKSTKVPELGPERIFSSYTIHMTQSAFFPEQSSDKRLSLVLISRVSKADAYLFTHHIISPSWGSDCFYPISIYFPGSRFLAPLMMFLAAI